MLSSPIPLLFKQKTHHNPINHTQRHNIAPSIIQFPSDNILIVCLGTEKIMETSILSSTQRYAACALFSLALNQSQHHQWRLSSVLPSLDQEPISEGMTAAPSPTVSDRPHLWIHEDSGLLLPVFRFMKVEDKAWDGLKETAGTSTQMRHHVGAFLKLLEDGNETSPESADKELGLLKSVDAMVAIVEGTGASALDSGKNLDGEHRCCEKYPHLMSTSEVAHGVTPSRDAVYNAWESHTCEEPVDDAKLLSCQRKVSVLYELLSACLLGTSSDAQINSVKGYDSRHRVTLRLLATWLDVKWTKMEAMEAIAACYLYDSTKGETEKREYADNVGASGIAAAATSVGSVDGSIGVGASFGAVDSGLCSKKMAERMGSTHDFGFKALHKNHKQGRLAVGIMVSGLVLTEDDFLRPWQRQNVNLERYALHWEFNNVAAFSTAVEEFNVSNVSKMISQGAMQTVLGSPVSEGSLPAQLANASDMMDSKWTVALDRSDKAGKLLAEVLLEGHHGNRPVTLIGFSLGARLIFKCLQHLAETDGDHDGLVERVVLLGAPISLEDEDWKLARKVVPGRFINAYSTNDWTLGVIFRSSLASKGVAGIQPADVPGIENVEVTHLVEGHTSYISMVEEILERLELDTYSPVWIDVSTEFLHENTSETQEMQSFVPQALATEPSVPEDSTSKIQSSSGPRAPLTIKTRSSAPRGSSTSETRSSVPRAPLTLDSQSSAMEASLTSETQPFIPRSHLTMETQSSVPEDSVNSEMQSFIPRAPQTMESQSSAPQDSSENESRVLQAYCN